MWLGLALVDWLSSWPHVLLVLLGWISFQIFLFWYSLTNWLMDLHNDLVWLGKAVENVRDQIARR